MAKCEKCRERAATVFIKRVVDTQATQVQLCEECARDEAIATAWLSGAPVPPDASEMPLDELLLELLTGAPDPDSFAPEDDKWSLQKLAAYDRLHSKGEFSADEDLADLTDEMDDTDDADTDEMDDGTASALEGKLEESLEEKLEEALGGPLTPEQLREFQEQFEHLEPEEREAMNQMFDALEDVHDHLESIMLQQAQDLLQPEPEEKPEGNIDAHLFESFNGRDPFADEAEDEGTDEDGRDEDGRDEDGRVEPSTPPGLPDWEAAPGWESAPHVFKSAPAQRCPKCRTTWDRLREDGRVGCASCYEAFEEALAESLEGAQGLHAAQHVGKAPRAAARRQRRLETLRARRDERLAQLRERLAGALSAERFEEAARMRDEIRIVESTIIEPNE